MKELGGLEAPNFQHYFLANQLQYLLKWTQHPTTHTYPWLNLEQSLCSPVSITDLPFLPQSIKKMDYYYYYSNIIISSTLTAWSKANKITKSTLAPCRFTPIWHNPDFLHTSPNGTKKESPTSITYSKIITSSHSPQLSRNAASGGTNFPSTNS